MDREIIYRGRNNSIDLLLKSDGSAHDLSGVTHAEVTFGSGVTLNSGASPWFFSGVTSTTGQLVLKFGTAGLTAGIYDSKVIIYDTSNTSGVMWGKVPIKVE